MPISLIRAILMLLAFVAFPATAADALFRSSFESSICDTSLAETEPNDFAAIAQTVPLDPTTKSAMICGVISPPGSDVDYFRLSTSSTSTMLIETIKADGVPCDPNSPMSLTLLTAALTTIATDSSGGVGGCASLDGVTSSMLQNLPSGIYYIRVTANVNSPLYALSIRLL